MPLHLYGIRMPWRLDEFIRWRKNRMKVMSSNKHELAQLCNGPLTGTTWVGQYLKHSPCDTHPDHWTSFINFLHLLRSYPWHWILLLGLLENPVLYIICRMLIGKGQKSWHMPNITVFTVNVVLWFSCSSVYAYSRHTFTFPRESVNGWRVNY